MSILAVQYANFSILLVLEMEHDSQHGENQLGFTIFPHHFSQLFQSAQRPQLLV